MADVKQTASTFQKTILNIIPSVKTFLETKIQNVTIIFKDIGEVDDSTTETSKNLTVLMVMSTKFALQKFVFVK